MLTVVRSDVDAVVAAHVTAEDLATFEGDGYRYDLLAGDLIRAAPWVFAMAVWPRLLEGWATSWLSTPILGSSSVSSGLSSQAPARRGCTAPKAPSSDCERIAEMCCGPRRSCQV